MSIPARLLASYSLSRKQPPAACRLLCHPSAARLSRIEGRVLREVLKGYAT